MALDRNNFSGNVGAGSNAPKLYTYRSAADAINAIKADGYFNGLFKNLETGDVIIASGTTGTVMGAVNAVINSAGAETIRLTALATIS